MNVAHRDRSEPRRTRGARHETNLAIAGEDLRVARRHGAFQVQADKLAGDAAMAAMQHADDHFLSYVATLRQRDRAVLDCGLERNSIGAHVDPEDGISRLDTRGFERGLRRG